MLPREYSCILNTETIGTCHMHVKSYTCSYLIGFHSETSLDACMFSFVGKQPSLFKPDNELAGLISVLTILYSL